MNAPFLTDANTHAVAGRVCPRDYTYDPPVFYRSPDFTAETLFVIGGLYGNRAALQKIEEMAASEPVAPQLVFNGDFHWFDAEAEWFSQIEDDVAAHRRLRGNVETEIARDTDIGAGCGCAYPVTVGDDVVQRSNEILRALRSNASAWSKQALGALPMHLVAQVGGLHIGIVHGDAGSLAGWRFARERLDDERNLCWLDAVHAASRIDVFACTHTCQAALRDLSLPSGRMTIANSGAAGMPNFSASRFGLITRIATTPSPHLPLYGLVRDGVHIDAISVDYDHDVFLRRFLGRWPESTLAHASYYRRIVDGPDDTIAQAAPR